MTINDLNGTEVSVGDSIAYAVRNGNTAELVVGTVLGFEDGPNQSYYQQGDRTVYIRIQPHNGSSYTPKRVTRVDSRLNRYVVISKGETDTPDYGTMAKPVIAKEDSGIQDKRPSELINFVPITGIWDELTTRRLQEHFECVPTGIIERQVRGKWNENIYSAQWIIDHKNLLCRRNHWGTKPIGSEVIRKLQLSLGIESDGLIGPHTILSLQRHLGTPADKVISRPSLVVANLQRRLNQRFVQGIFNKI